MAQHTPRRRTSRLGWLPLTLLVLLGAGAAVATLYFLGDGKLPWQQSAAAKAEVDRAGKKPYPRAARNVPAFQHVTLDYLLDPKSGEPLVVWLEPEKAKERGLLETSQVLGRVTKADKRGGYVFTEADFLPAGSPASRTAAIPAGMHGVTITAAQVPTMRGLKAGDSFILVAAASAKPAPLGPRGSAVSPEAQRQAAESAAFVAMTRRIVDGGLVIEAMPDTGKGSPKDETFVAVPDAQYGDLVSALNNGIEITCLAQSTNPLVQASPLPEPQRPQAPEQITIVNGDETRTVVLPAKPNSSTPNGGAGGPR